MASIVYPKFKESILQAGVNLSSADVKVTLVDTADYTYSAAHDFYDDVTAGGRVATSGNLANKTFTNGVFDADDVTITGVTGDVSEALVVWVDTGVEATSRLVAYIDTVSGGGALSFTPNGGNLTIQWDSGANKIFAL